jgi:hypothetical protein
VHTLEAEQDRGAVDLPADPVHVVRTFPVGRINVARTGLESATMYSGSEIPSAAKITRVDYAAAPLSLVLARYLLPFWLFRDASRGDQLARAAAYRHNRQMRSYLPLYIRRWSVQACIAFTLTFLFDPGSAVARSIGAGEWLVLLTAGAGIVLACCLCMLLVMGYAYVYLGRHE